MEKQILILQKKRTQEFSVYQLDNNQEYYNIICGETVPQIPFYEGFELLLTTQYELSFTTKQNLDWLIDILNPDQYNKVESEFYKTEILYKKDDKTYMLQDTKTDWWYFDDDLIWVVFETKFADKKHLFRDLTKGILLEVYKCKVVTTEYIT